MTFVIRMNKNHIDQQLLSRSTFIGVRLNLYCISNPRYISCTPTFAYGLRAQTTQNYEKRGSTNSVTTFCSNELFDQPIMQISTFMISKVLFKGENPRNLHKKDPLPAQMTTLLNKNLAFMILNIDNG